MCRYTTLCNIKVTVLNISDMWWDFKLLNHNTLNCYSLKHCNKSVIARDMASGRQTDRQTDRDCPSSKNLQCHTDLHSTNDNKLASQSFLTKHATAYCLVNSSISSAVVVNQQLLYIKSSVWYSNKYEKAMSHFAENLFKSTSTLCGS